MSTRTLLIVVVAAVVVVFATMMPRNGVDVPTASELVKNVSIDESEGFVDFDIPLASVESHSDGSTSYFARGMYHSEVVALRVVFPTEWRAQMIDQKSRITFHW